MTVFESLSFSGTSRHRLILDVKSRPDPPTSLRVANVTHDSAHLVWTPGFHGGMDQYFRVRYTADGNGLIRHYDVYPENSENAVLPNLDPGRTYSIPLMAFNNMGESNYTADPVIVRTPSECLFSLRVDNFRYPNNLLGGGAASVSGFCDFRTPIRSMRKQHCRIAAGGAPTTTTGPRRSCLPSSLRITARPEITKVGQRRPRPRKKTTPACP